MEAVGAHDVQALRHLGSHPETSVRKRADLEAIGVEPAAPGTPAFPVTREPRQERSPFLRKVPASRFSQLLRVGRCQTGTDGFRRCVAVHPHVFLNKPGIIAKKTVCQQEEVESCARVAGRFTRIHALANFLQGAVTGVVTPEQGG